MRYAKEVYCLLNYDGEIGNVLFYMAGSILGTFYRMEWFAILLIDLLMARLDVLKNILKALKTSMSMLQMLALFGVAFIAIFSIFSLHYYAQALYPSVLPTEHCESVADCIMELYIREEIGESMSKFQLGRFLYDTIYVIFMDFLFGNIVGGVLIDNFAELRGKREKMIEDKKGKCFICGIDR